MAERTGALAVRCPICGQTPGAPCRDRRGAVLKGTHPRRQRAARVVIRSAPKPQRRPKPRPQRPSRAVTDFHRALRALKHEAYSDSPNPRTIVRLERNVDRALEAYLAS